jgi:NTE family protein
VLLPWNWPRLASPYFGRIDLAAELYEDDVFDGKTFADLKAQGRPFIILNATNLETGGRFDFTALHFAAMGSDTENYSVGRAVAASSAFPFLPSPISLNNYPTAKDYTPPGWYAGGLKALHTERRRFQAARELSYYLDKDHKYVHLMDGGLADNIGARAVLDAYSRGFINTRINNKQIDKLVLIVANARTQSTEELSHHERPPRLTKVAFKTATISMDNYNFDTVAQLIDSLRARVQAQKDVEGCQRILSASCPKAPAVSTFGKMIDPYIMEINFDGAALVGEDPQYYLNLSTSFSLEPDQVKQLVQIGPKLLRASPQYRCLLAVLQAEASGKPRPPRLSRRQRVDRTLRPSADAASERSVRPNREEGSAESSQRVTPSILGRSKPRGCHSEPPAGLRNPKIAHCGVETPFLQLVMDSAAVGGAPISAASRTDRN